MKYVFFITKRGHLPYSGSSWPEDQTPRFFTKKEEAVKTCEIMDKVNPVGFNVIRIPAEGLRLDLYPSRCYDFQI
jgi:hypothetical protein